MYDTTSRTRTITLERPVNIRLKSRRPARPPRHPPPSRTVRARIRQDCRMAQHIINSRPAVDRAGAAEVAGIAVSNVDRLYRERATSGFPEHIEGTRYWYEDDIRAFKIQLDQRKLDALTSVDRGGDPDEYIGTREIARVVNYADTRSLYGSPIFSRLLTMDHEQTELGGGRVRRRWRRRDVWAAADGRVGKGPSWSGRPVGTPEAGAVDRTGDPDEIVDAPNAARILGYSHQDTLPSALDAYAEPRTGKTKRHFRRSKLWEFADEFRLPNQGTPAQ